MAINSQHYFPGTHFLGKAPAAKDSVIPQTAPPTGDCIQIPEPVGYMSHLNHHSC